jgi:hypothetical protein
MSKQTYSIDVTVRVVIEAESQQEAEALVAESLLKQPNVEEYYNLQSREGSHSALFVGDITDKDVWRPSVTLGEGKHYFTPDGTYGDASDLAIISTTNWTDKDWWRVEECTDNDRYDIASIIDDFRSGRALAYHKPLSTPAH